MGKGVNHYIVAWILAVAVFHGVAFLIPDTVYGPGDKNFWVFYALIIIGFIGQLVCSLYYAGKKNKAERFLFLPIVLLSYSTLIGYLILGAISVLLQFIPLGLTAILAICLLAFYGFSVLQAVSAAQLVLETEKNVAQNTSCMYTLTARARALEQEAVSDLKQTVNKVWENLRYSDPVSSAATADMETQIQAEFDSFCAVIREGSKKEALETAEKINNLIKERNELCRLTKR